ncbi:MAG: SIR2 family protein [Candidatus Izemoplasmataceae bacterium]
MNSKNPYEYISGVLQTLASDKKRIGFLCGAGTSFAKKDESALYVPNIQQMSSIIIENIKLVSQKFNDGIISIQEEAGTSNIEKILDLIERKIDAIGLSTLNGLSVDEFKDLKENIEANIFDIVSVVSSNTTINELQKLPHYLFARWIGKADRKYPIEIFTTNYDYLFESCLEANNVPYFDGFTGSLAPFFYSLSVEDFTYLPNETKLWKLHGSLGWKILEDKIVRCKTNPSNKELLIYPSSLKYSNSKKMPYIAIIDRLCNFIEQEDSILIVLGYSFGDEHINERIITSLKKAHNSHVFAFVYDKYENEGIIKYQLLEDKKYEYLANQSSRLSFIGMKSAIVGGLKYDWLFNTNNTELNEDFTKYILLNEDKSFKELLLPDFVQFIDFITSMMNENDLEDINHERL